MQLNKAQDNRYSRDKLVSNLLKSNKSLFTKVPRLVEVTDLLGAVNTEIGVKASEKDAATSGTTEGKVQAETTLIDDVMKVGGGLRSLAQTNRDTALKEQASL